MSKITHFRMSNLLIFFEEAIPRFRYDRWIGV